MRHVHFVLKAQKLQFLAVLVASLSLLSGTAAHAQITPLADSYINTAKSTTNYGSATTLEVDGATLTTYIRFNLASIPTNASVSRATLKLFVNSVTEAGSFNVDYVSASWSESTIDSTNAPPLGAAIASNVDVTSGDANQYVLVNVTSAVKAWLSGSEANNGLALVANSTFNATFDSKENTTTSHPPELDIAFAGGSGTITGVETGSSSGLTGGGTSGTLNLGLTKGCSANQVLQWNGSAWECSDAGAGTITGVTAGTGLTGGGTGGNVTLNLNTSALNSAYAQLGASNTFSGTESVNGAVSVATGGAQSPLAALTATGSDSHSAALYPSLAVGDYNGMVRAGDQAIIYTAGTKGTGGFVIAPWEDVTSGLRLDSNGNVGIGVASPGAVLDVRTGGTAEAGSFLNISDSNFTLSALDAASSGDEYAYAFYAGYAYNRFGCLIDNNGNFSCFGTKSAVVDVDGGSRQVALYAVEAPENWFEDYGLGQLSSGSAHIVLDPTFAQTVNTNLDYHVFITPRGECEGLYVTGLTPSGFEVRELHHGSSSVAFDYRIIAKRKNYENLRLADRTKQSKRLEALLAAKRQGRRPAVSTGSATSAPLALDAK